MLDGGILTPHTSHLIPQKKHTTMNDKKRWIELAVKIAVAALTAFLTALGTTSCMRCMM